MEMASYHILITNEYHVISYITNYFSNITLKFNKGPKSRGNTMKTYMPLRQTQLLIVQYIGNYIITC